MPWKDGYTISDEKSLDDKDIRWPDGKRCAVHIVVDLSMAGGPEGISAKDVRSATALFAAGEGLDLLLAALAEHGLKATFAVPAAMARIDPARIKGLIAAGHEVAAQGLRHEDVERAAACGGEGPHRACDEHPGRRHRPQAHGLVLAAAPERSVRGRHHQPQHHGPADRGRLRLHGQLALPTTSPTTG